MDTESPDFTSSVETWYLTETNETTETVPNTTWMNFNDSNAFQNVTDVEFQESVKFPVQLKDEPWVIPLLALSSLCVLAIIIFEIFVLYKSYGSRHHQFLGQALLFGLFLCSILGYAFVLTPHWVVCAITRAGVGLAYSTVFATLLVKCFFLLNLHNGNYLSSAYQCVLLLFAIGIQVSVFSQWLIYRPPDTVWLEESPQVEVCKTVPIERAAYLSYVMFLLLMAVILSIRSRSLKENNKEAIYIGVAVGIIVILWVAWMSVFIIFDRRYEDPAQGFGLVFTTIVIFLLVFIPKAVQLSSRRKHGSTNGSHSMIYSPSFLHLQPHAVLPSSTEGTLIKQHSAAADYCRGFSSAFLRYDYPTFYQMEPRTLCHSDRSSQRKSNVSFAHTPLY